MAGFLSAQRPTGVTEAAAYAARFISSEVVVVSLFTTVPKTGLCNRTRPFKVAHYRLSREPPLQRP